MPTLGLALGLGMIKGSTDMLHTAGFEPFREITGDVRRAIVAKQSRIVNDVGAIAA